MAKTFNCKSCSERTVFECVSFDKDHNYGDFRRCNLCGDITKMTRRLSVKRKSKLALIDELAATFDIDNNSTT